MDPYDKNISDQLKIVQGKGSCKFTFGHSGKRPMFFSSGWPLMIELFNGNFIPSVLPQAMYSKEILWPYGLKI